MDINNKDPNISPPVKPARKRNTGKKNYINLKDFDQKKKAFYLFMNEKWCFFQAHKRSTLIRIAAYILGVYIFGLSVTLYMDLNLGVVNEDLLVFALVADIWTKSGDNIEGYYSFALTFVYVFFWLIVVVFKIIKLVQWHRKRILTFNLIYEEISNMILDLIPVFLWPAAVEFNVWLIDPETTIKPLDPSNVTGDVAIWNEWIRSWILWASYILFCLGLAIIVSTKMLQGPYNGLSGELAQITKIPYSICRVLADTVIIALGTLVLLTGNYSLQGRLNHLYSWVSYATILMAFFAGPLIGSIAVLIDRYIKWGLLDIDPKLYRKLKREVLATFRAEQKVLLNAGITKKSKLKWRIMQDNILDKYNQYVKDSFIEENKEATIIDQIIK